MVGAGDTQVGEGWQVGLIWLHAATGLVDLLSLPGSDPLHLALRHLQAVHQYSLGLAVVHLVVTHQQPPATAVGEGVVS